MKVTLSILMTILVSVVLIGCGGPDAGTPSTEKIDLEKARQKQSGGPTGVKAARGGGLTDDKPEPAPPGVKTGLPSSGAKAGG